MKSKMLSNKFALFLISAILLVSSVIAVTGVMQTDKFFDSSTGSALTGVTSLLFACTDSSCSAFGNQIHDLNSGSSSQITFEYPYNPSSTSSNLDYFGHYLLKKCYLPKEFKEGIWGYGTSDTYNNNFNKAASCHSPIDNFTVTNQNYVNEPIVINMVADLGADVHSAFTNANLAQVPSGTEDYYSVETKITLEITNSAGAVVNTQTKTYNIMMDTTQNVQFTWTPQIEGNYNIKVKTEIIDCQCQSTFEQNSQKDIVVWAARPQNQCYTLVNNLKATPEFAHLGDSVNVSFSKISNYADNNFAKTAVPTKATYTITDASNNIIYNNAEKVSANADTLNTKMVSFNWSPSSAGSFNIKVVGVGDSLLCAGKTNPEDTAILGFFVAATQATTYQTTFIVTDEQTGNLLSGANVNFDIQQGTTNSAGKVTFNSASGIFNFQVSLSGYDTKTGTANVVGDSTISVSIKKTSSGDGGGGGGSGSNRVTHTTRNIGFQEVTPSTDKNNVVVVEDMNPKETPKNTPLTLILLISTILILGVLAFLVSVALRR